MKDLENIFQSQGGEFISPLSVITERLSKVKAYIFDWDGVFNDGTKHQEYGSPFSEIDSMGTNMLRFAHFLNHKTVPKTFIISGERNVPARTLAERERFDGFYYKTGNKLVALDHICSNHDLEPSEICFVFDDILDLSLAKVAGLRIMVRHSSTKMLMEKARRDGLTDYITGNEGGQGAVREASELLISAQGLFDKVVDERVAYEGVYSEYLAQRQMQNTTFFTIQYGQLLPE